MDGKKPIKTAVDANLHQDFKIACIRRGVSMEHQLQILIMQWVEGEGGESREDTKRESEVEPDSIDRQNIDPLS
jgi:hypothetical protein